MERINTDGWRTEPGNLDDLNAKQGNKLSIEPTGEPGFDTHIDGPRVARCPKTGEVVAVEEEGLHTHCRVSPKLYTETS
jgi:hypothetical protein